VPALIAGIRAADRALTAGDPAAAVAALDTLPAWNTANRQIFARLASAWLQLPDDDPEQRFRKRVTLAAFEETRGLRANLALGRASWPQAEIDAVAAQARAWLER
jgi:hypothetical protein